MVLENEDAARLQRLRELLDRVYRGGIRSLPENELLELPRLYRFAASYLARLRTSGAATSGAEEPVKILLARAHALLHRGLERPRGGLLDRLLEFLLAEVPRTIRGEWKVIAASAVDMKTLSVTSTSANHSSRMVHSFAPLTSHCQALHRVHPKSRSACDVVS